MLNKLHALRNKKGFTLVELLVVIVIMCILAAILIPTFSKYVEKAENATIVAEARAAQVAASVVCQEDAIEAKTGEGYAALEDYTPVDIGDYTDVAGAIQVKTDKDGTVTAFIYTNGDKQVEWTGSGMYEVGPAEED